MRVTEVGQQLRAFRMESGLRADEIAARLGVSRAALYRYEKGEVIKLDTIQRLGELLNISPLSLLGLGYEYYTRPIGYFERIRQIEETAEQIVLVEAVPCYLTTSSQYDAVLADALGGLEANTDKLLSILSARKAAYARRPPAIIAVLSAMRLRTFLRDGIAAGIPTTDTIRAACRSVALAEAERIAAIMEAEPMSQQYGLLAQTIPTAAFRLLRGGRRTNLAINPFPPDSAPHQPTGIAMVTSADDALTSYRRLAETYWQTALKGKAAATAVRDIIAECRAAPV